MRSLIKELVVRMQIGEEVTFFFFFMEIVRGDDVYANGRPVEA